MRSSSNIRTVDPVHPDDSVIREAAEVIKKGGVVVFPTRTLYGIGADAFNTTAVHRVFYIKKRSTDNPLSVLIKSIDEITSLATQIPFAAVKFMESFWPGRLTIVFFARPSVPANLTANTGKVGIRVPEHPVAVRLVAALEVPLTGTSANLSGKPGVDCVDDLPPEIINHVDLIIDAGKLKGGIGSTVVDVTTDSPRILREGVVRRATLLGVL